MHARTLVYLTVWSKHKVNSSVVKVGQFASTPDCAAQASLFPQSQVNSTDLKTTHLSETLLLCFMFNLVT